MLVQLQKKARDEWEWLRSKVSGRMLVVCIVGYVVYTSVKLALVYHFGTSIAGFLGF